MLNLQETIVIAVVQTNQPVALISEAACFLPQWRWGRIEKNDSSQSQTLLLT